MGKTRSESSKADRKFEKKLDFYSKVRETVASLGAQKVIGKKKRVRSRQKKLKAYDLSALSDVLPELKSKQQPTVAAKFKLNSKSRKNLLIKETERLKNAFDDSVFQADPWSALHQHLLSTQPVEEKSAKKRKGGKKKVKGKRSKASSKAQSMEISV